MTARPDRWCEKISHLDTASSWAEIGERVAEARQAAGLNQGELAERLDIDRTSVVRMEAGERKISALELFRLAEVLGVPTAHFVARPPAPLLSRRTALDEDSADLGTDLTGRIDPVALAARAREVLGSPEGPLPDMADVAERFDLYLVSVPGDTDGASLLTPIWVSRPAETSVKVRSTASQRPYLSRMPISQGSGMPRVKARRRA